MRPQCVLLAMSFLRTVSRWEQHDVAILSTTSFHDLSPVIAILTAVLFPQLSKTKGQLGQRSANPLWYHRSP